MKDAIDLDGVELLGYTAWGPIDLVSADGGDEDTALAGMKALFLEANL